MFGGVTVVTWYPITPSSSLVESLICYMRRYRIGPDGKATFAIVQAEDELAAIGMVMGAGWAGARAMTATAGPGISLMSEFAGLGYFAEVPAVIWDVQRVGPSTGLPTRTSQGDVLSTAFLSHGDTRHLLLLPGHGGGVLPVRLGGLRVRRAVPDAGVRPVGPGHRDEQLDGRAVPLPGPAHRTAARCSRRRTSTGWAGFERYRDVDGDGIGYRTLPGTDHPAAAYFARGTGHNEKAQYSERPDDWEDNLARLERKMENARTALPAPVLQGERGRGGHHRLRVEPPRAGGGTRPAAKEKGLRLDYLRVRAYPFRRRSQAFVERHPRVYVVEQNRDGQLAAPAQAGPAGRAGAAAAVGGPHPRAAARRAQRDRRRLSPGRDADHGGRKTNRLGLTQADYKGGKTTLCAGCGHNAISERMLEAMYELGIQPERVAKLSGIGCSSKSPAYFMSRAHGFNAVHGRMPSVATGALLANRTLIALGVSGDGDTASIGIGQFVHLVRRNLPLVYVIEDNGVYGLTKGQFSATADVGSTLKTGVVNEFPAIDTCLLAIEFGCHVRRAQLLGGQEAAVGHAQGGPVAPRDGGARRHLALRDLQRPRGVDQVVRVHEGPRRADPRAVVHAGLRGHRGRVRRRHHRR